MHGAAGVRTGLTVVEGTFVSRANRKISESGDVFAAILAKFDPYAAIHSAGQEGPGVDSDVSAHASPVGASLSLAHALAGDSLDIARMAWIEWSPPAEGPITDEDVQNVLALLDQVAGLNAKTRRDDSSLIPGVDELRQIAWRLLHSGTELNPAVRAKLERFLKRELSPSELFETVSILLHVWQWGHSAESNREVHFPSVLDGTGKAAASIGNALKSFAWKTTIGRRTAQHAAERQALQNASQTGAEQALTAESAPESLAGHSHEHLLQVALTEAEEAEQAENLVQLPEGEAEHESGDSADMDGTAETHRGRLQPSMPGIRPNGAMVHAPERAQRVIAGLRSLNPLHENSRPENSAVGGNAFGEGVSATSVTMSGRTSATDGTSSARAGVSPSGAADNANSVHAGLKPFVPAGQQRVDTASQEKSVSGLGLSRVLSAKSTVIHADVTVQRAVAAEVENALVVERVETAHRSARSGNGTADGASDRTMRQLIEQTVPVNRSHSGIEQPTSRSIVSGGSLLSRPGLFAHVDVYGEQLENVATEGAQTMETAAVGLQTQPALPVETRTHEGKPAPTPLQPLKTASQSVDVSGGTEGSDESVHAKAAADRRPSREALPAAKGSSGNPPGKTSGVSDTADGGVSGEGATATTEPAEGSIWDHSLHTTVERVNRTRHANGSSPSPQEMSMPPDPERLSRLIRSAVIEQSHDRQTIHLQLEPEALGRLQLRVAVENGAVTAHFVAETEAARRLIEAGLQQLKESLNHHGVDIQEVEVSLGHDGGFGDRHDRQPNARTMERLAGVQRQKGIMTIEAASQAVYGSPGGVDVRI